MATPSVLGAGAVDDWDNQETMASSIVGVFDRGPLGLYRLDQQSVDRTVGNGGCHFLPPRECRRVHRSSGN